MLNYKITETQEKFNFKKICLLEEDAVYEKKKRGKEGGEKVRNSTNTHLLVHIITQSTPEERPFSPK